MIASGIRSGKTPPRHVIADTQSRNADPPLCTECSKLATRACCVAETACKNRKHVVFHAASASCEAGCDPMSVRRLSFWTSIIHFDPHDPGNPSSPAQAAQVRWDV